MRRKIFILVLVLLLFIPALVQAKDTIRAVDILNRIKKGENILIEDAIIKGELDFTLAAEMEKNFEYNDTYYYEGYINSRISFVNCEIENTIIFNSYEGRNSFSVIFTRAISFNNCEIAGIKCSSCDFTGGIYISDCEITKSVSFSNTEFYNYRFYFTKFLKEVRFYSCEFFIFENYNGMSSGFAGSTFKDNTEFDYCTVYDKFNFRYADFEVEPVFTGITFEDNAKADFTGATLNGEPFDPFNDDEEEEEGEE